MTSTSNPASPGPASDAAVQALLAKHRCPTPLHQLRTLFLGCIASPQASGFPMTALALAWGGQLPVFDDDDDLQELLAVVVQGLWNRLADHQSSRHPFRLMHVDVAADRQALHHLALTRVQEIGGFADGLFGQDEELLLPQKAHQAVRALGELHAMFAGAADLLADETAAASESELKALLKNLQEMTLIANQHINQVVQACKRARGRHLEAMATEASGRFGAAPAPPQPAGRSGDRDAAAGDEEPPFVNSPLSRHVTRHGVTVQVHIYADRQGGWILEVVDVDGTSHVWEDTFPTDQQALDEALRALDEEPLEFEGGAADQHRH